MPFKFQKIVGYLLTINAPATELSTVAEILNKSELICKTVVSTGCYCGNGSGSICQSD